VTITVKYRDRSGEWGSRTMTKTVSISAPSTNGFDMTLPLLLVAGGVAIWWFRFRKKKTQAS